MTSNDFFQLNIKEYSALYKKLTKKSDRLSFLRLTIFIVVLATVVYLTSVVSLQVVMLSFLIGLILFIGTVSYHKDLDRKKIFYLALKNINEEELQRKTKIMGDYSNGSRFSDPGHPFSYDLDLFGEKSLFHHINRCHLPISERLLADFLLTPTSKDQITQRQNILKTLSNHRTWVQEYIATLRVSTQKVKTYPDLDFLRSITPKSKLNYVSWILRVSSLIILTLYFIGILPFVFILAFAVMNYWVMVKYANEIFSAGVKSGVLMKHIQIHLRALEKIHQKPFSTPEMEPLTQNIHKGTIKEIKKLENTIRWMESRSNPFYAILNAFLLMDLQTYHQLSQWVHKNRTDLDHWFDTVYKMEMYCSIVSWMYHQESYSWPILEDSSNVFEAKNMGHPLIKQSEVVKNDFRFDGSKLYLVTGSNMSGKSTFLRTVGLNALMAWVGLPVCASNLSVSKFNIYTSMRTQDNLAESTSSFYAELKRIRKLFERIEKSEIPVLFFLDEILKGTNSDDRHSGARGIIEKLVKNNCSGFISTHDLQLADEFENHPSIKNISFNSHIENGQLKFDYKLSNGKCHSSNATLLMKSMNLID